MNSSVIGKIEKAKRYAEERKDRVQFKALSVEFKGENGDHQVSFDGTAWHCSCDFFDSHKSCAHSMALERVLDGMLPASAATPQMQQV